MKFKHGTRRRAAEYEKDWVERWGKDKTFEKSVDNRPLDNAYVFYDGPPFLTGLPHHGHILGSTVKDAVARYWTMKGKRVERVWGWDCHGLPAENYVEKQLGITDRRDIGTKVSLEDYINTAKKSMVSVSAEWESTIARIGRWVDFHGAYKTMDKDFMESVWWAFKELYNKGKIYEGEKVLMYDTKFATPVSKNEVTMDNDAYREVTDPSAYVKFKIKGEEKSLLAWTTTPWTLPANMALAVNPKLEYAEVETAGERFIVAKKLVEQIFVDDKKQPLDYEIVREMPGTELVGLEYKPLFKTIDHDPIHVKFDTGDEAEIEPSRSQYKIYAADFVEDEGGTGIVHAAPAYGEDDFKLAQENNIPVLHVIDDNGYYFPEVAEQLHEIGVRNTDETGIEVWESNKFIAKCLQEKGIAWKIDHIRHEYPFNPRSGQRVMYRAIPSWFLNVQNNKFLMLEQNENIKWFPNHIKHGRFEKNIEQAPDWNISRNRFWATAMPVWKGDNGTIKVVGSYTELKELSGTELEDYHRPWVDQIEFDINGEHFKRIDEVLDCWFESGSMPFAQFHYPFENKEKFEANYPGDFIVEYVAQVRAWFYYVHVINTALFGTNAFKDVIVTGTVAGNDGRKMSKSLGNFTDPNELMDKFSADSLRFLLLGSPLLNGEDFALQDKDVSDIARKLSMIWNMYDFFTMYAEVDKWEFVGEVTSPENLKNPLDIWIVSRLHQLIVHVTKHMNEYNIPEALSDITPFIDDASNWFVRRSRRRFWKSEDDADKNDAYRTLHYVLACLAEVMAPFTPFLAEELWSKVVGGKSVHLRDWPMTGPIDEAVLEQMKRTREVIEKGLALRMERNDDYGQIKVRQPLASLTYTGDKLDNFYEQIITEEVNVKEVKHDPLVDSVSINKKLTEELKQEGLARELIRVVQNARKDADLNVDDRIQLTLKTDSPELQRAIQAWQKEIQKETLAIKLTEELYNYRTTGKVDGAEIQISLIANK